MGDELVIQVLAPVTVNRAALERAVATGPAGYHLVHWRGHTPLVNSYALAKRAIADAPNTHWLAPPWDRELVRRSEQERASRGADLWVTGAVVAGTPPRWLRSRRSRWGPLVSTHARRTPPSSANTGDADWRPG